LAFIGDLELVNAAKMAILLGSLLSGVLGFLWLSIMLGKNKA
jgi:NhaA family Na+:H+ antiporter